MVANQTNLHPSKEECAPPPQKIAQEYLEEHDKELTALPLCLNSPNPIKNLLET